MEAPSSTQVRRAIFGDERYTESYVIQVWYLSPEGEPALWRLGHARTLAGAQRVASSNGLVLGCRGTVRIVVTKLIAIEDDPRECK